MNEEMTRKLSEATTAGEKEKASGTETKEEHSAEGHSTLKLDVVLFLFICLFIGQLMKQLSLMSGVPYTSLVTIVGLVLGTISSSLGRIGEAIDSYSQIDAHLLLLLFLPALIFESAFNSDWHIFKIEFN